MSKLILKQTLVSVQDLNCFKKLSNIKVSFVAAALLAIGIAGPANADVVIDFRQIGADVVATANGSIDLSPFSYIGVFGSDSPGGVRHFVPDIGIGPARYAYGWLSPTGFDGSYWLGNIGVVDFGNDPYIAADIGSGDQFFFNMSSQALFFDPGYVSNSQFSGSSTFLNKTIASLILTPGQYVWTVANDTVTVNISAVPEPASWAMMIIGFGVVGVTMRRQKIAFSVA